MPDNKLVQIIYCQSLRGDEGGCISAFSAPFAANYYVISIVKRFLDTLGMTVLLVFAQTLINTYSGYFRGKLTVECVMRSNVVDDR